MEAKECYCGARTKLTCDNEECQSSTCSACLKKCKTCGKRFCEDCIEEHEKLCGRPEFRPGKEWPEYIDFDCGCRLQKEPIKGMKGYFTYYIETFCSEHDPSLWENYDDD